MIAIRFRTPARFRDMAQTFLAELSPDERAALQEMVAARKGQGSQPAKDLAEEKGYPRKLIRWLEAFA